MVATGAMDVVVKFKEGSIASANQVGATTENTGNLATCNIGKADGQSHNSPNIVLCDKRQVTNDKSLETPVSTWTCHSQY